MTLQTSIKRTRRSRIISSDKVHFSIYPHEKDFFLSHLCSNIKDYLLAVYFGGQDFEKEIDTPKIKESRLNILKNGYHAKEYIFGGKNGNSDSFFGFFHVCALTDKDPIKLRNCLKEIAKDRKKIKKILAQNVKALNRFI